MTHLFLVFLVLSFLLPDGAARINESIVLPKPDQPKPDQSKPDQSKPDQSKPDQSKPDQNDDELFPISEGGKTGYIDIHGKVIIEPRFKESNDNGYYEKGAYFKDGLAIITESDRGGFID